MITLSKTPPQGTPPPTRPTSTPPPGPRPQPTHPQPSGPPKVEFDWAFHMLEEVGRESGRARPTSSTSRPVPRPGIEVGRAVTVLRPPALPTSPNSRLAVRDR